MEDFNVLLRHEQVELIRAQCAPSGADRDLHRQEARSVAKLIEDHAFPYRSLDKSGHRIFDAHIYDDGPETAH